MLHTVFQALAAGAVLPEDRGDDAEAPAEGIPQSLLSQSPRSLLMAGLAATSTNGSGNGAVTALGPLLQDLCQQLVAEADAQRVAQLLPGERNAGLWLEGDSDAQRKIVLQLAAAAGSGGAADHRSRKPLQAVSVHSGSDDELNSPRESSESDDWGHAENQPEASLSHALSLAERYSVDAWEVNLEYCIAVLQTAPGSRGISVDAQLAEGWPALLASNPRNALEGLVTRVLPVRSDAQRLALVLNLCAECCDAQTQDGVGTALRNLGLAVQGLADAAPGIDVHALLGPTLTALTAWAQCGKAVAASSPDEAQAAIAAAVDDLPSLQDVSQLARAIDALQLHQKELTDSISGANGAAKGPSIPAISGSTAFAAAACRELASMTMAEGVSEEARTSLDQCFCGMTAPDIAAVASFACFHGPPPLATAQGAASPSVLLSNEQSLAVVEAALRALPNAQGRETEGVLRAVPALETERARLTAFQRIAAVHHLTEPQSEALQAIVGKLLALAMEHSIDEALSLIGRQLAELLAAGCPVLLGIVPVGAALLPLAAGVEVTPADSTAVHAAVQGAADVAVDRAMLALAGDGDNAGLSVGDAVQSLYGILRSLDDTSPGEPGSEPFFPLSALRTHVWEQLERHVAARGQGDGAAAAAEAHLQVLEMLGLLGESMWGGWTPPAGALAASLKDSEALLHSRVAAALGPVWPGALQAASISAQDFASVEAAETALLRLIGVAEGAEQLQGVLNVLADVLSDAFMPQDASEASIHPLHSCWSACSAALLLRGVINPVLAALDAEHSVGSTIPVVTASEAVTLVEAADAAAGTIAAAAVGALMPYPDVRSAAWTRVLSLQATDDTQALPGALPLAVISLQQGQLPALAAQVPRVFKQLMSALLRCGAPAFCIEPIGGGARGAAGMPLRSALAAAAVAQLITAGERSAAGWLALEHSGVHPFLRTVNSAPPAVARLLRVATKAAGLAGVELEPAAANVVVTARCAEDVVQRVLKAAAEAERVWHGDTLS